MVQYIAGGDPNPPLRGMLHKKHQNSRFANWGKRYFEVDDERGILYYFRTRAAQEWDEPARHFMLSTLRSCTTSPSYSHALEVHLDKSALDNDKISDTPDRDKLVLRAGSEGEQQRWLAGLQARIEQQARKRERPPSQGSSPIRPASPEAADGDLLTVETGDSSLQALRPSNVATSPPRSPDRRSRSPVR